MALRQVIAVGMKAFKQVLPRLVIDQSIDAHDTAYQSVGEDRYMSFPRLRFTVRRLMVAVAVVAVLLGAFSLLRRASYCMDRAAWHAAQEARLRDEGRILASDTLLIAANLADPRADEHARLSSMYQHVAFRPWESLPDDPFREETPSDQEDPFLIPGG
jgi:hypothetical protein